MKSQTLDAERSKAHKKIMSEIRSICVYCGSSTGLNPIYREAGVTLGRGYAGPFPLPLDVVVDASLGDNGVEIV